MFIIFLLLSNIITSNQSGFAFGDPFKTTRWDRPERYLSNHTKRLPDSQYCFSLNNNPLCHTRSKALLMSQNTTLLLFLLFINDIVTDIKASIKLFADDTSLYVTVDTPQNAADIIKDFEERFQILWRDRMVVGFTTTFLYVTSVYHH
jgi:hypothetical protein